MPQNTPLRAAPLFDDTLPLLLHDVLFLHVIVLYFTSTTYS